MVGSCARFKLNSTVDWWHTDLSSLNVKSLRCLQVMRKLQNDEQFIYSNIIKLFSSFSKTQMANINVNKKNRLASVMMWRSLNKGTALLFSK